MNDDQWVTWKQIVALGIVPYTRQHFETVVPSRSEDWKAPCGPRSEKMAQPCSVEPP